MFLPAFRSRIGYKVLSIHFFEVRLRTQARQRSEATKCWYLYQKLSSK